MNHAREVDIDDPGTWVPFRRGLCDMCMAGCCTLIVEVTGDDLVRMGATDQWELENDRRGLIRRLQADGTVLRYNTRSEKFILARGAGGECIFLTGDRRCSIYEKRPSVCRSHPDKAGPRRGFCPYRPKALRTGAGKYLDIPYRGGRNTAGDGK